MTREDVNKLFDLLAIYRPGDRHLSDKTLRKAWLLVLEPFKPSDVKQAVGAYFRECKYWPDVSDIAMRCPPAFTANEVARLRADMDWMDKFLKEHGEESP